MSIAGKFEGVLTLEGSADTPTLYKSLLQEVASFTMPDPEKTAIAWVLAGVLQRPLTLMPDYAAIFAGKMPVLRHQISGPLLFCESLDLGPNPIIVEARGVTITARGGNYSASVTGTITVAYGKSDMPVASGAIKVNSAAFAAFGRAQTTLAAPPKK